MINFIIKKKSKFIYHDNIYTLLVSKVSSIRIDNLYIIY